MSKVNSTSSKHYCLVCPIENGSQGSQTQNEGIRIQYLDDWLVRATYHQTCLQHTQTLVAMCWELSLIVNMEKSELEPKQIFNFIGYQFDVSEGKVIPTLEHAGLKLKNPESSH